MSPCGRGELVLAKKVLYCPECHAVVADPPVNSPRICQVCKLPLEERLEIKLWRMDASLVGQKVVARVLVAGESQQKAMQLRFEAHCTRCEESDEVDLTTDPDAIVKVATRYARPETLARHMLSAFGEKQEHGERHEHRWSLHGKGSALDYRILKVRDLVEIEETAEKALTSRDYYTVLFMKLPTEKKLLVDGIVLIHPKFNDLMLLVRDAAPLTSVAEDFQLPPEDIERLKPLQQLDYPSMMNLVDCTVAPQIVGRPLAKLASYLTVNSPTWLPPLTEGQPPQPGCIRTWSIGDMRCGKGSIDRWWKEAVNLGEHGFGEAASRAGLLYWVDPESIVVVWGLLVQADLGLAILEGMHGLPAEQIPEFREALAQQKVEVRKKATGLAWARARILADANPWKLLKECVYPCQALLHVKCLPDPADITRIDLAIPFDEDDVPFSEIEKSIDYAKRRGLDIDLLRKLALWAWSRKTSQIHLTDATLAKAREVFKNLQRFKSGRIPLIHNGSFAQILRVSTAFAVATFSTPDGERLIVEARHVELASQLLTEILEHWALEEFVEASGVAAVTPEELQEISELVNSSEIARNALFELSFGRYPGKDLAVKLGCNFSYLRDVLSQLRAKDLVIRRSEGYDLSPRGASVVRELILKSPRDEESRFQRVRDWILKNRDQDGLVDINSLTAFIKEQGLDVSQIIARLRKEGSLVDVPIAGKMGIAR